MSVKNVVKVMNFHSLLRVDKARKKADMYFDTEEELFKLIKKVIFNKNILLDKKWKKPKEDNPILNVYIGNDLGFCGDFNFAINKEVRLDKDFKILIGKKINKYDDEKVLLSQTKEDFFRDFSKVQSIIIDGIFNNRYSAINVIYNHYHNIDKLEFTKKKLYPLDYTKVDDEDIGYDDDFAQETEINSLITNLISLYLCYELKICEMNSYAAENVIRQQLTNESLKKIDELEEEKEKVTRKYRKKKEFEKIIENYRKE